jgi:hypothetical protein
VWFVYESTDGFANQSLVNPNTPRTHFNLTSFASSVGFAAPLGGTFFYLSTNPSQVGTTTGILSASTSSGLSSYTSNPSSGLSSYTSNPVTTTTTAAGTGTSQTTNTTSTGAASRVHLEWVAASVLVAPLVTLLL